MTLLIQRYYVGPGPGVPVISHTYVSCGNRLVSPGESVLLTMLNNNLRGTKKLARPAVTHVGRERSRKIENEARVMIVPLGQYLLQGELGNVLNAKR